MRTKPFCSGYASVTLAPPNVNTACQHVVQQHLAVSEFNYRRDIFWTPISKQYQKPATASAHSRREVRSRQFPTHHFVANRRPRQPCPTCVGLISLYPICHDVSQAGSASCHHLHCRYKAALNIRDRKPNRYHHCHVLRK